jgi:hypothetical protein
MNKHQKKCLIELLDQLAVTSQCASNYLRSGGFGLQTLLYVKECLDKCLVKLTDANARLVDEEEKQPPQPRGSLTREANGSFPAANPLI